MTSDKHATIVVAALASIMVAVVIVLLVGLFSPIVDNDRVFTIIGPAFQTVVGAFVGFVSGKNLPK